MARALIAWELGSGYGHIVPCLRMAEGLVARGHKVTLVLKDVRLPGDPQPVPGVTLLPAPLTPHFSVGDTPPVNYADVLRVSGFSDAQDVASRLTAWQGIFALTRPDIVVADHAPTALLAARLADVPYLSIGNGFAIPPAEFPWPSIRPWETITDQSLSSAETRLDRVLDAAQKSLGHTGIARARDLFGPHDILDTFAELDHYGARLNGRYVGPIVSESKFLPIAWQSREAPKVLAYLRPGMPGFMSILQAFARLDAEVICIAHGIEREVARRMATRRFRIALAPIDMLSLLPDAHLVVTYGSSGFSTQALLAGVPLSMRPRHVEQALFAHRVEALGAGQLLRGQINAESVTASLQELLDNPAYRQAAHAFQSRHLDYSPDQAVEQSLSLIEGTILDEGNTVRPQKTEEPPESPPACLH